MRLFFLFWISTLLPASFAADHCFTDFQRHLGIEDAATSDIKVMADLLENQFYLKASPQQEAIYGDLTRISVPFGPTLREIQSAIEQRHPGIDAFLCAAVREKLVPTVNEKGRELVNRTLHHLVILERMVDRMVKDPAYAEALEVYYREALRNRGLSDKFLESTLQVFHATGSLFEIAKQKTVELSFHQYLKYRQKIEITEEDLIAKNRGLHLNVLEALSTDLLSGFIDNARAAMVLAIHPVKVLEVTGENRAVEQELVAGWSPLYETWNLAFITGNLQDLQMLYPKLLIPSVIGAEEKDYLFRRGLALWVSITLYLIDRLEGRPRVSLPQASALAQRWGEINLQIAQELPIPPYIKAWMKPSR